MLERLTDTTIETQRQWLRFILERVGHNNLPGLLDYYKDIGWIGIPAANRMLELATEEKPYKGTSWTLSAEEHKVSRLYIEKLKGKLVDETALQVPQTGRAKPVIEKKVELKLRNIIPTIHPLEKKKMEFTIHRREVTIKNLEQELGEKDAEIDDLKGRILELEEAIDEHKREVKKNKIFMELFDQNSRLKKAIFASRKSSGKK